MPNKIKLKRSTTASSVPTGLEAGEIAVNITDRRLFVGDGTNSQELTRRAASSNSNRVQLAASTGSLTDTGELTFTDSTSKTLALGSTRGISIINDPAVGTTIQQNGNAGAEFLLTQPSGGAIWLGDRDGLANNTYVKVYDADGVVDISGQSITLSGTVTTGDIKVGSAVYGLQLGDNDGSHYVQLKAPGTVTSNVTLILPATPGSNGQVLTTNGTGTLSWTSAGGFTPVINDYTSNSSYTIPAGATMVRITCIGGGGGGGSGRMDSTTSTQAGGGSGGLGGGYSVIEYSVAELGGSGTGLTVTVGAGGAGGAARTSTADGLNGSNGGDSEVTKTSGGARLCIAGGGIGGVFGKAGGTISPTWQNQYVSTSNRKFTYANRALGGSAGAGNGWADGGAGYISNSSGALGTCGGGGGGGINPSNGLHVGGRSGNIGNTTSNIGGMLVLSASGGTTGATGGNGGNALIAPGIIGSTGGGGGGGSNGTGGNGGSAEGAYGCGGGGGAGGRTGSGAGGAGGSGIVRIEVY